MSKLRHHPVRNTIVIGLAVSLLVLAGAAAFNTIQARHKGEQMETAISRAQDALTKHDESLRESLAAAAGFENLTMLQAKSAAAIVSRRPGVEGGRLAMIKLAESRRRVMAARGVFVQTAPVTNENATAVATASAQYFAKLYAYTTAFNQAKHAYAAELDSPWSGLWLHVAGYPKIALNPVKPRPVAPKVSAELEAPAAASGTNPA